MNNAFFTNQEKLAFLKSAYFDALKSYNESYSETDLVRLHASEDAYMSFVEFDDNASSWI